MLNLKIRSLEDSLINDLNASDVPVEAKRLVLQNVLNLIKAEADKAIMSELEPIKEAGELENAEST